MGLINIAQADVISDAPSLATIGMNVLNFLLSVFGIVAIIMLALSGVMYFFSTGNEEQAKKAKQSTKYAVIGVLLTMSGLIIVKLLAQFIK
jgi:flagellar basal body-associated protein FliL